MRWLPATLVVFAAISAATAAEPATSPPRLDFDTRGFTAPVLGVSFSPDNRWLAASGNKEVRIWDLRDGRLVATLRGQSGVGTMGTVYQCVFSPDGRWLLVGVQDMTGDAGVRIYDTADYSEIAGMLGGHRGPVTDLAFSRDGRYLATASMDSLTSEVSIYVWDWPNRRRLATHGTRSVANILYLGFPDQSETVLAIGSTSVLLGGAGFQSIQAEQAPGPVRSFLQRLGSKDGFTWPYDEPSPHGCDLRLEKGFALFFGKAKNRGHDRYWTGIWSTQHAAPLKLYGDTRYVVLAAAMNGNGSLAASADGLGDVHVWEPRTGKRRFCFRSLGLPAYNVGLDASQGLLAFGTTPYPTGVWTYNHYGALAKTFDLRRRVLLDGVVGTHSQPPLQAGDLSLRLARAEGEGTATIEVRRQNDVFSRLVLARGLPFCFGFLRAANLGFSHPLVAGTDEFELACFDPQPGSDGRVQVRRWFLGHQGTVAALSESADGRFLASACTDGVLRIYSLEDFRALGDLDFNFDMVSGRVNKLPAGSSGAAAGIQVGDHVVGLDGIERVEFWRTLFENVLLAKRYRAGQTVTLDLERDGRRYQAQVRLVPGPDYAEPLLNLFITSDGQWILWTPQGYYDASPGADDFIGWRVNRGLDKAALFYGAGQFRKLLYRPDIVDKILELGNVDRAIAALPRQPEEIDLRHGQTLLETEPPKVEILRPADGFTSADGMVEVTAQVTARNDLPITEIKFLVNGRPPAEKNITRQSESTDLRAILSQQLHLLPGRNSISVLASNRVSTSSPATISVHYTAGEPAKIKPNLYLLAVGVSKYRDEKLSLRFAHRDAEEFVRAWKRQEGQFFEKVESRLLVDEDASAQNVRNAMDWLIGAVTQHDVAVLFFSAHGVYDPRRNYYLATHEVDPDRLRSTAVPYSDINLLLGDMPCKVLLYVDTCHGGAITGAKSAIEDPWRDLVSEEVGAILFASSHPREISLEDSAWQHGAFTKAFLEMMTSRDSDLDRDGYLSVTEMDYQLSRRVKLLTGGKQHPVTKKPPTIRDFNLAKAGLAG